MPSLRWRLALLVLIFALPAMGLVGVLAKRGYDQERASTGRHLVIATRAVAVLVERKFESAEALLQGLAALPALREGNLVDFEHSIRAAPLATDEWIVLIRPDGQQLINTRLPSGELLPQTIMPDDFWPTAERGERHVSDVFVGTVVGAPVLTVSIPITEAGQLRFALVFAMLPSALARAVASQQITSGGVLAIFDRSGVIAVRNRSPERFVGHKTRPELFEASAKSPEGVVESVSLDGIPTLTAFSRSAAIGWTAVIGASTVELYAPARSLLQMTAFWTVVVIFVAGFTATWIARAVIRGMDELVLDTQTIGAGDVPPHRSTGLHDIDVVANAIRVTAQKLQTRERELKQINQTLEQRVTARTRELSNANRDLEDFARVAAHDLRQPLRSMISFAEILRDEHGAGLDREARNYLDRLCAAARRLSAMLEAILAYSTASAAPLAKFEAVDLNEVSAAVRNDLADRLQSTKGEILTGALCKVDGDPQQIHQLLLNLVGNSLKFHRPGIPPVVRIECRCDDEWVRLTVADNGRGFDAPAAERIFTPFERLERDVEGSGIGLAIVRRIVERHGGSVVARSRRGVGSEFELRLPKSSGPVARDSGSATLPRNEVEAGSADGAGRADAPR